MARLYLLCIFLLVLSHYQFLGHNCTILFNDIDQIDAFVPISGVDIDYLAFGLVNLLSYKVYLTTNFLVTTAPFCSMILTR